MIKFAVCDDEQVHIDILADEIEAIMAGHPLSYDILQFRSGAELLGCQEEYQILFLDIRLEEGADGIQLGKILADRPLTPIIILVSSLEGRVTDGYHINALRYLLKPVDREALREALQAALNKLLRPQERLTIRFKNDTYYIPLKDILYVETYRGQRRVETISGTYRTNERLESIATRLPPHRFFPVNRSYYVNLAEVRSAGNSITLTDGTTLNIARGKKSSFIKALHTYMGGLPHDSSL